MAAYEITQGTSGLPLHFREINQPSNFTILKDGILSDLTSEMTYWDKIQVFGVTMYFLECSISNGGSEVVSGADVH